MLPTGTLLVWYLPEKYQIDKSKAMFLLKDYNPWTITYSKFERTIVPQN